MLAKDKISDLASTLLKIIRIKAMIVVVNGI
jgi:hypothetical protein